MLRLAFRNLRRNMRRSLLTLAAIAFGLAFMAVGGNLQAGQHDDIQRSAISALAGEIVVDRVGYRDDHEPELAVPSAEAARKALADAFPGATVTSRIALGGLLTSPTSSVGAALSAVDPVAEAAVQDLRVVDGAWLDPAEPRGIVIGKGMAETLGVKLGDKLVFMGQYGTDEVQSRLFRVRGIFRTGSADVDGSLAWANLVAGQELLVQPDVADQIAVHLPGGADEEEALAKARAVLAGHPGELEILHWRDALPEIYAMLSIDRKSNDILMGILGIIVAMGVLNTVLMSVMERTREFGVLMAIGMRPRRLAGLVLLEALLLGLAGAVIGLIVGAAMSWPLVTSGLDYTDVVGETYETAGVRLSGLIKARYAWDRQLQYGLGAVAMTVAAALYPALQVTRLTPVAAMRKV